MTKEQAQPLLDYIANHINLTHGEVEKLLSYITYRKYLKGQYLVQQGDTCRNSCFVLSGCTKTFIVDEKGQEHIVMFAIEDWWTSDLGSYITQTPADYNVQCLEDTEILQFSYETDEEMYKEIPKLERLFRKILEKAFVASQKRIIKSFSLTAKEQYVLFKKQYPKIEKRIPQYMVASYLGITKEFLSKIKRQIISE